MMKPFVDSSLMGVAISAPIVASAAVILRFIARRKSGTKKFRADDWLIVVTLVFCWGHSINTIVGGAIGGIKRINVPPPEYANIVLRTLWISLFFLVTSLYTVKLSILLFYHHLFSITSWFRIAVYVMITMISLWWVSAFILIWLVADPVEAVWKDSAHAKHRYNFNNWYISYSGLSIFFDVVILCFPIPMIKSLHVSVRKKLSILGIFWLGAFVCVSAIVRFVIVYKIMLHITYPSQRNYGMINWAFIWAEIEPNMSVIAACLPTYGPFFPSKGLRTSTVPVVKSFLNIPNLLGKKDHKNRSNTTNTSNGYHELDETVSSKASAGEIVEIQDKNIVGIGTTVNRNTEV